MRLGRPVIALIGLVLVSTAPAAARGINSMEQPYRLMLEGDMAGMGRGLSLSAAQREQMGTLHKRDLPKIRAAKAALEAQTRVLFELYSDPMAEEAKLRAQFDKVQGVIDQAMAVHFDHMLAMRAVLTPAQRDQFLEQGARLLGKYDEHRMHSTSPASRPGGRGR